MVDQTTEYVHFRLIEMPCCGAMTCWVNPRYPNYCPECGKYVFGEVRGCVLASDPEGVLKLKMRMT